MFKTSPIADADAGSTRDGTESGLLSKVGMGRPYKASNLPPRLLLASGFVIPIGQASSHSRRVNSVVCVILLYTEPNTSGISRKRRRVVSNLAPFDNTIQTWLEQELEGDFSDVDDDQVDPNLQLESGHEAEYN
ncbi:hypothetical protein ACJJTC_001720 [Scirpophaga incertulas]